MACGLPEEQLPTHSTQSGNGHARWENTDALENLIILLWLVLEKWFQNPARETIITLFSGNVAGSGKTYSYFVTLGLTKVHENLQTSACLFQ